MTESERIIRRVRKIIREYRAQEDSLRSEAPSRSTGIRNVYKGGYQTLEQIERAIDPGRRKK